MLHIFITLLTFVLILITLFMMLVILMQRPNTNAGMGAAFGGGVTESTFGAETTNILTKATKYSAGAFFLVSITLFMLYLIEAGPVVEDDLGLPDLITTEAPAAAAEVPVVSSEMPFIADEVPATVTETAPVEVPVAEETTPVPSGE